MTQKCVISTTLATTEMTLRKGEIIGIIIGLTLLIIFVIKILPGYNVPSAIPEPHTVDLNKVTATKFIADIENLEEYLKIRLLSAIHKAY